MNKPLCLILAMGVLPMVSQADASSAAMASACDAMVSALPSGLSMVSGSQRYLSLPEPVSRLALGDPAVADVALVAKRNLLLQAKKAGVTTLMVWSRCSAQPMTVSLTISGPGGMASRSVSSSDAAELPSQVQADIRFVELSRSRLRDLGTRFQWRSEGRSNLLVSPGAVRTVTSTTIPGLPSLTSNPNSFSLLWGGNSSRFLAAIDLLESSGYAYTLAKPSLVAMSGQTANFLAGGEVPIPVPQTNNNITIEYKQFGIRLALTPTIVSRSKIVLKVSPEVSDLDFSNGIVLQNIQVPSLRVRRADTSISLGDGESFIIGGLINKSTTSNVDKLPGLGNLPLVGALFRSTRFESEDRELLMIVTPRLIQPIAAGANLPALPGDDLQSHDPATLRLFFLGDDKIPSSLSGFSR